MGRKYRAEEFATQPKPHIKPCRAVFRSAEVEVVLSWKCSCKTGSIGYGITPAHAYKAWLKNWTRRKSWYTRNQDYWQARITNFDRRN